MSFEDTSRLVDNDQLGPQVDSLDANRRNGSDHRPADEFYQSDIPQVFTSQISSLLIVVNLTIGTGLLTMPYAMQTSGLVASLLIQIVFLIPVIIAVIMMTELTVKSNSKSFHNVIEAYCSPLWYKLTQVILMLTVFGTVVALIVTIGDQTDRLFSTLYGQDFCHTWFLNRRFSMVMISMLLIKPLCCAKTVDFLKYASFLGLISIGFIMYVMIKALETSGRIATDVNYWPNHLIDLAAILPVFALSYQCNLSWVSVVSTVRKEEKYTSYKTISLAMVIATVIYASFSMIALFAFGSKVKLNVTENLEGSDWPVLTTLVVIAIKCIVTIAPAYLPMRHSLQELLESRIQRFANLREPVRRYIVGVVPINMALILALLVPNILTAVNILGCLSVLFVFALPGLSYLKLIDENRMMKQQLAGLDIDFPIYTVKDKFKLGFSYAAILSGVIVLPLAIYVAYQRIMNGSTNEPLCV